MSKAEVQYCTGQFPNGCGQRLQEYPLFLEKPMVRTLTYLALVYPRSVSSDEIGAVLGKVAYTKVSHLKYFDLVEQGAPENSETGEPTRGWWRCTPQGIWFLTGEHRVPLKVWVFRGERVRFEGPAKYIEEVGDFDGDHYQRVLEQWRPHDFELPPAPTEEDDDDDDQP